MCRSVSLDEGLSQSNVLTIARDDVGFLWIGTRYGLNRYDFEKVRNYYSDPADSLSIPGNEVRALFVDAHGRLFVGCTEGCAIYNRETDTFKPLRLDDGKPVLARSFIKEDDGVFIGGQGNLYYFDNATSKVRRLPVDNGSTFSYTAIYPWGDNEYLLVTRWDGLWLYDRRTCTVKRFPYIDNRNIMTALVDKKGRIWISPYGDGIYIYSPDGKILKRMSASNSELPHDIVVCMTENEGRVWIGTDGGGVAVFDIDDDDFVSDVEGSDLRSAGVVTTIHVDQRGNVFGGTAHYGAFLVVPTAMNTTQTGSSTHSGTISTICVDDDGSVWFGNQGHGLLHRPANSEIIRTFETTNELRIVGIAILDKDRLLLSTYNKGFYICDKTSGRIVKAPKVLDDIFKQTKTRALPIRLRNLAGSDIALVGDVVKIYHPATQTVSTTVTADDMPAGTQRLQPFYNKGNRLLTFSQHTVTEYDHSTGVNRPVLTMPDDKIISSAAFDGSRNIYIGTAEGVMKADIATGDMEMVSGTKGIHSNALAVDSLDRLWIATTQALLLKLPKSSGVSDFGYSDGVMPNEYNPNAVVTTPNHVYMGGSTGILTVKLKNVESIISDYEDPRWNLADIIVDGQSALGMLDDDGIYRLPANHSDVRISIIDMGDNAMRRSVLKYYVDNGSSERVVENQDRTLSLSLPQHGTIYRIYASSFRPDGTWTGKQYVASVTIPLAWWKSWWAIAALVLFSIALGAVIVRYRMRRLARKAGAEIKALRRETVRQKEKSEEIVEKTDEVLRSPLTLAYAQARLLKKRWNEDDNLDSFEAGLDALCRSTEQLRTALDSTLDASEDSSAPGKESKSENPAAGKDIDLAPLTAVVAESDRDLCLFVADELSVYFDRVFYAMDSDKALQLVEKYTPEIVVASSTLRGTDSASFCRSVRDTSAASAVVLLATRPLRKADRKTLSGLADEVIVKPFDIEQLTAVCRKALDKDRPDSVKSVK